MPLFHLLSPFFSCIPPKSLAAQPNRQCWLSNSSIITNLTSTPKAAHHLKLCPQGRFPVTTGRQGCPRQLQLSTFEGRLCSVQSSVHQAQVFSSSVNQLQRTLKRHGAGWEREQCHRRRSHGRLDPLPLTGTSLGDLLRPPPSTPSPSIVGYCCVYRTLQHSTQAMSDSSGPWKYPGPAVG